MTWARIADDYYDHPKILAAGPAAERLWVRSIAYCNRYLTDGFLAQAAVKRLADDDDAGRLADRLVIAGLWEAAEGGYRVHDFLDYQPSAATVKAERERNAERARTWRERQRDAGTTGATHGATAGGRDSRSNGVRAPAPDPAVNPDLNPDPAVNPTTLPSSPRGGGDVPSDVVSQLSELSDELDAAAFHDAAEAALTDLGFVCEREAWIPDRGDGRGGRLDLVAVRHGLRIALELDDRTPRPKSVQKLTAAAADCRVIVLRCPADSPLGHAPPAPPGIDAVIGAGRRPAPELTTLSSADRKLWKRAAERLRSAMKPANWDQLVGCLEPLGRNPDGGLVVRAPPGQRIAERARAPVAVALVDEGDEMGGRGLTILEGG